MTEGQADELLWCFCRDANVSMSYRKFARGRLSFKKSIRNRNSVDRITNGNPPPTPSSASSSNYLKLPKIDTSDHYPVRDIDSSHSRSTISSTNKPKWKTERITNRFLFLAENKTVARCCEGLDPEGHTRKSMKKICLKFVHWVRIRWWFYINEIIDHWKSRAIRKEFD